MYQGDLYYAGRVNEPPISVAKYWKNDMPTNLPSDGFNTYVYSMSIDNDNVYIAGVVYNPISPNYMPTYWENGVEKRLSSNDALVFQVKIKAVNDNVYVTANEIENGRRFTKYYKNGEEILFINRYSSAVVRGITLVPK